MRKYRGKRVETEEWIYGYLIGDDVIVGEIVDWDDDYFCTEFWYKVDSQTVGQQTRLKCSVSDEEWYEGDMLTPNPHSERTELEVICFDRHQGKYKSVPISLYRSNAGNGGWTGYDVKCYQKRVGNIYEHKHLLNLPGEVDHE